MRSPIWWFGGKGNMARKLIDVLPEHRRYIEVFGGGASMLFAKPPKPVEVYNDLDSGLVAFFRVLRDEEKFACFHRLCELTPYAREEYDWCREHWQAEEDEVRRAWAWFVVARMSFAGVFGNSWGFAVDQTRRGMAGAVSLWLSCVEMLPQVHERIRRVQIENRPWQFILDTYDGPDAFFYLDPPYLDGTRLGGGYAHEMTDAEHEELCGALQALKGKWLLSGYPNELYQRLLGAPAREWQTACYAVGRTRTSGHQGSGAALAKSPRTESVWSNYPLGGQPSLFEESQP